MVILVKKSMTDRTRSLTFKPKSSIMGLLVSMKSNIDHLSAMNSILRLAILTLTGKA